MKAKQSFKKIKGITLIALVVTVIITFILASVSISSLFGENGIINKAKLAKAKYEQAVKDEQVMFGSSSIENLMNSTSNNNQVVYDNYFNRIVIPAGFKIVKNGDYEVEYNYIGDSNHYPAVQDGIVIENEEDHNQFVWIPIGEINNKDGSKTTITLGRYDEFTLTNNGRKTNSSKSSATISSICL